MRHSMATITRRVTGSLEATQAVTGHKDQRMAQHYAQICPSVQREAVGLVEKFIQQELLREQNREQARAELVLVS